MLAYIKGSLEMKYKNYIVIDVSGLGYKIFMSENAINSIGICGLKKSIRGNTLPERRNIRACPVLYLSRRKARLQCQKYSAAGVEAFHLSAQPAKAKSPRHPVERASCFRKYADGSGRPAAGRRKRQSDRRSVFPLSPGFGNLL